MGRVFFNVDRRFRIVFSVAFLFLIAVCLFLLSVYLRKPWSGEIVDFAHQSSTSRTVTFLSNWHESGIGNLRFSLVSTPPSIEYMETGRRVFYGAWPPAGFCIQYFLLWLFDIPPGYDAVTRLGLLDHFVLALFCAFLAFSLAHRITGRPLIAFLWSLPSLALVLFLPGPMFYAQNLVYGTRIVVSLLAALALVDSVLLARRQAGRRARVLECLEKLLLFLVVATHWLGVFIVAVLYLLKVARGEMGDTLKTWFRRSVVFGLPALIALALYGLQILWMGYVSSLASRAGLYSKTPEDFFKRFWSGHFADAFGESAVGLFWITCAAALLAFALFMLPGLRRRLAATTAANLAGTLLLLGLPPLLMAYALPTAVYVHGFSAMFFVPFMAVGPFALLPLLLLSPWAKDKLPSAVNTACPVVFMIAGAVYILWLSGGPLALFPETRPFFRRTGEFIRQNTAYADVVVSTTLGNIGMDARLTGFSLKNIHPITSAEDAWKIVRDIPSEYSVVMCEIGGTMKGWGDPSIEMLVDASDTTVTGEDCTLYRIPKTKFEETYRRSLAQKKEMFQAPITPNLDVFQLGRLHALACDMPDDEVARQRRQEIEAIFAEKKKPEHELNDRVTLCGHKIRRIAENRFAIRLLFYLNDRLDDAWRIGLLAEIDESQKERLPEKDRGTKFLYWNFNPVVPTSRWKAGTYTSVGTTVKAVPAKYMLRVGFYDHVRGNYGQFRYVCTVDFEQLPMPEGVSDGKGPDADDTKDELLPGNDEPAS